MNDAAKLIRAKLGSLEPSYGMILGSGLGGLVDAMTDTVVFPFSDLPGFPESTVSGHAAEVIIGNMEGVSVTMLSGRVHYYEAGQADAMRTPIETLQQIGVKSLLLSNSAGSVDANMPAGSVMMLTDHINWSGMNPLIGEATDDRFVSLSQVYDLSLQERFLKAASASSVELNKGVYMWFSGPTFETPAEINASRILGANAIGMSTVPEAILARFFGLRVAAFSVITNLAAGLATGDLSHTETKEMAPLGGSRLSDVLRTFFAEEANSNYD
ncbi:MAG: purine-nucleoside phosphorylase [Pseudomonadota bacterium]